ncbi:MAG: hypothetical protein ACRBCK_07155 [Alphaproteobacteria bacterium]
MKYSVYGFLVVFGFGVMAPGPYITLNAAELWNSPSGTSKAPSGKAIYNGSASHYGGDVVLYNRTAVQARKHGDGYLSSIDAYKVVRKGKKTSSKLWKFMGRNAALSRQSDVDVALQQEYELQIANSKYQIAQARKFEQERREMEKLHGQQIADYKAGKQKSRKKKLDQKVAMLKKSGIFTKGQLNNLGREQSKQESVSQTAPSRLFNKVKK